MIGKLMQSLRKNTWLLLVGFAAFMAASGVGFLADDVQNDTAGLIWALAVWVMIAIGAVILVGVVIESAMAMLGME
ncbi:MAG TPA: hypothetical protein VJZ27_04360 [Aggregatilineales bacterium]|nr:hypothetical protein [Aggregatilineales bacterium]